MNREDLKELQYIAAISNVASIMAHGILSHKEAEKVAHYSVAMPEVQELRAKKVVPGGRPLHDYANLYVCARNPMLYKRCNRHAELCVLRVGTEVLDLRNVVISDGNAASAYTAFGPSPWGLGLIDKELVLLERWTDPDVIKKWHKARVKCAEVLVPEKIEPRFITGAYVSCTEAEAHLRAAGFKMPITVDAHLFFR